MAAGITSITGLQNLINLQDFRADNVNSLTTVDLSGLTNLDYIDISDNNIPGTSTNSLISVNLTGCVSLERLRLDNSDFSAGIPNLTGLTSLQFLDMDQCSISGNVDLSMLPALTSFDLSGNTGITSVTIFEQVLNDVDLSNTALIEASVNDILGWLDGGGELNGYVNLSGGTSAFPSGVGITAKDNLIGKGWSVNVNAAPSPLILGWDDIANANTLVGDASIVSNWNTFFDLPTNGTPFTSVTVVGNDVQLYGASGINLKDFLFANNNNLISVNDTSNAIITAGTQSIAFCSFITTINLPALTIAGSTSFRDCISITSFDFPSLTAVGFACFAFCSLVTSINLPSCTNLGGSVGDDSVFAGLSGNTITATFNNVLATCNEGLPDGDIQTLVSNNTVTITYV